MSPKKTNTPDDDFFDEDLFDSDLFDDDDENIVVHSSPRASKVSVEDDEALFDDLLSNQMNGSVSQSSPKGVDEFDEEYTEVIMDEDDGELPNTYFTDDKGKVYNVTRTPFLIGRSKECDLVINVKGVSRRHAELTYGGGHFILRDLDSLNGTRVNGTPVPQIRLGDADVIKLGRHKFSFFTDTVRAKPAARPTQRSLGPHASKHMPAKDKTATPPARSSDWLVKINVLVVAFIILVLVTYVILEDSAPEQSPEGDTGALALPTLPADNMVGVDPDDWTQTGQLPPIGDQIDEELEEIARAVEAQMKNEKSKSKSTKSSRSQTDREKDFNKDLKVIRQQQNDKNQEQDASDERDEQTVLEQRNRSERAEANNLLESIDRAYVSGDQLSVSLTRMKLLSRSDVLTTRMRRDLGNIHDIYKTLSNQYSKGLILYDGGSQDEAFKVWKGLLAQEKKIIGDQTSYYSRQISQRAIDFTLKRATTAEEEGRLGDALKLYQRLVELKPEGAYKARLEQLLAKAEETFDSAEKMMKRDPAKAVQLFQAVIDSTPRDHQLHIRAEAKLVWLKEGL